MSEPANRLFGRMAQRLAGLAARALGWRPHEFWAATPSELATALMPPADPGDPLSRETLQRLMEIDDDDAR